MESARKTEYRLNLRNTKTDKMFAIYWNRNKNTNNILRNLFVYDIKYIDNLLEKKMRFIGCKTLLLDNIKEVIKENNVNAKSFCDIFSGTSTVARFFKKDFEIYSNDLLYFSYILQMATVENDKIPEFKKLREEYGIKNPIFYFNEMKNDEMEKMPTEKRFIQNTYAPNGGRMYVTNENALRIDFARYTVEKWYKDN